MKYLLLVFALLIAISAVAEMTTITIVVPEGESVDLVQQVPFPVDAAIALLNPPAEVNGRVTDNVSFQQDSTVIVKGPTTITLSYGTPETPGTTPDAIGGGE